DAAHPVFSKLSLETESVPDLDSLLVSRRPRGPDEHGPWLLHQMTTRGGTVGEGGFESDREAFLGRLGSPGHPRLPDADAPAGRVGAVLDPILCLRRRIRILPGHTAAVDVLTGVAPDRAAALALARKYRERHLHQRVFQLAWTHEQVTLQQLNLSAAEAQRYDYVASSLLYGATSARDAGDADIPPQSALWKHGISGDLPIVVARIANASQIDLVRHLIQAHGFWQANGLDADLLIWNEELSGYRQELQDHILYLIESGAEARGGPGRGRMFAWRVEHLSVPDRALMLAAARCVFSGDAGRLRDQIGRMRATDEKAERPDLLPRHKPQPGRYALQPPAEDLRDFNGFGGFRNDGCEYTIWLAADAPTPAPWCNVLANAGFGSVVSESGGAYTFAENAHEFRLTPWYNDPLRDRSGEALWLRDEATGEYWSAMARPSPSGDPYRTCHGFGYTRYEHAHADLYSEVTVFVACEAPVKFALLKVINKGDAPRLVSVTSYVAWVLGEQRGHAGRHVRTEFDAASGALFAHNPFHDVFSGRIAFHRLCAPGTEFTADRRAFLGRNRAPETPLGMRVDRLDGTVGAGLDPCSAQRATFELAPGGELEIVIVLGAATNATDARTLVAGLGDVEAARAELERVRDDWRNTLAQVRVHTPDAATDLLVNGWLPYQVLASRLLARSGYYQSGGAFGFRDQLQDAMAILNVRPELARTQLLRSARHQFPEGDVQHWWHPPTGKGVRTRISDNLLWLPWCTAEYVRVTGDIAVLDERVPFIEGRALAADEESVYEDVSVSGESASLYEHCLRAIRHSLRFGAHGLPLIGAGDWNDGMNRLGTRGHGESVWLGMFLVDVLGRFAPLATARGDAIAGRDLVASAAELETMLQRHAW
ncbi:MAG: GH36-type glycosyl hydrolase domain-containing protein, partial [Rhodanobacteraceae bacterium]